MKENKYLVRIRWIGLAGFLRYLYFKKLGLVFGKGFYLWTRRVSHSLYCRKGSTDIDVFKHIYVVDEYRNIESDPEADLVIDCGANAGFSTVFLLNHFPKATVVAVEPDLDNFQILKRNTQTYGERCCALHTAVWSKRERLVVINAPSGDGREWARGVRPAEAGEEPDIEAVSIDDLLEAYPGTRVSLLKIDIEGAEAELFSVKPIYWLDRVDRIVIELHGDDCKEAYLKAVGEAGFESIEKDGLTFSHRIKKERST